MARRTYRARFRLFNDSTREDWVRFYWCEPGATPLPFPTVFGSAVHDDRNLPRFRPPLGEQFGTYRFQDGPNIDGAPGVCHVGTPEQYAGGLTARDLLHLQPLPTCCRSRGTPVRQGSRVVTSYPRHVDSAVRAGNAAATSTSSAAAYRSSAYSGQRVTTTYGPTSAAFASSVRQGSWLPTQGVGPARFLSQAVSGERVTSAAAWVSEVRVTSSVRAREYGWAVTAASWIHAVESRGGAALGGAADVAGEGQVDQLGGAAIGGAAALAGASVLASLGGFGLGGRSELGQGSIVASVGGLGLGGAADVAGEGQVDQLGGLGTGGAADVAGEGQVDQLGGLGTGGAADMGGEEDVLTGAILAYGGTSVPTGYLACDGSAVSRTTYAALFSAIGVTWGAGNGSTTFNLPDLRGRTLLGSGTGSGLSTRSVGASGGAESVTLAAGEIPAHTHPGIMASASNLVVAGSPAAGTGAVVNPTAVNGTGYQWNVTANTGGGGAHANMQPWSCVQYVIKT